MATCGNHCSKMSGNTISASDVRRDVRRRTYMLQTAAFLWVYATDLRWEGKHGGTLKQPFPTQPDLRRCTLVLFRTLPGPALQSQAGIGRHVQASTSKTFYQKDVRQDVRRIYTCKKTHLVSRCTPRRTPHIYMSKPAKGVRQDLRHMYICKKQWVRQLRPDILTYRVSPGFGAWPKETKNLNTKQQDNYRKTKV